MAQLGIVTGMLFEAGVLNAVARGLPPDARPLIACCGLGRGAAHEAAVQAVAQGATALMSFGIAAGLDPTLVPGAVVVASYVHDGRTAILGDSGWGERLLQELSPHCRISRNPIAHAHDVLMTPVEKAHVRTHTGASIADMESYGVAEVADAQGLPFATLRVVADTSEDRLPEIAVRSTRPNGSVDVMKSIIGALTHPRQIPELIKLGRRTQSAQQEMRRLARLGLPRRFFV